MSVRYVDEFRDRKLALALSNGIKVAAQSGRHYNLMEFCGGHTHAIFRYGILDYLPNNVHMTHGPGCPVCVLPIGRIDGALQLAREHGVILCTYGDVLRVPGPKRMTLMKAKAAGADIRMVYSSLDALRIAEANAGREVVFFAIGFETTTPPTAVAILEAAARGLRNFSVHCNHVITPSAIEAILEDQQMAISRPVPLDGFVGPGHVSTVIGCRPFEVFARSYGKPVVISGFEPLDVMQAILMLIRQLNDGRAEVENAYQRVVQLDGNRKAQALVDRVLERRLSFVWRGLGEIPLSALRIRGEFAAFDAEERFCLRPASNAENKACICRDVLRGLAKPTDCKLFAAGCTPENPIGSCMVSSEGACSAYYTYGRSRRRSPEARIAAA